MRIEFTSTDNALVARLRGNRLDAAVSESVKRTLIDMAGAREYPLVVNCSELRFIDSSGLDALLAVLRSVTGPASLAEVQPIVLQMLKVTRLDRIFRIWRSESEAIAAMAPLAR